MANNAATTTPPAAEGAIPLWIRLLLLITSWITPILLHLSPTVREIYDEGLQDFRHHHHHHSLAPTSPPSPTTFHQFSALSAELRLRIWSAALPLPGGSNSSNSSSSSSSSSKRQDSPHIFTSPTPPPTLLAVNAEARAEARRHYRLGLAPDGYPSPRVYVDLARDVVAVSDAVLASHAGRNLLRVTGDWGRVGRVCVPGGGVAEGVVLGEVLGGVLGERGRGRGRERALRGVFVVSGLVPAWAGSDFLGWARWMEGRGKGRWVVGGPDEGEGDDEGYEADVE